MMQRLAIEWCIHWLLDSLSKQTTTINWGDVKAQAQAKVAGFVSNVWLATELGSCVNQILDATHTVLADSDDLDTIVTDLANQDWSGAETALKTALAKVLPADLAALLAVPSVEAPVAA